MLGDFKHLTINLELEYQNLHHRKYMVQNAVNTKKYIDMQVLYMHTYENLKKNYKNMYRMS